MFSVSQKMHKYLSIIILLTIKFIIMKVKLKEIRESKGLSTYQVAEKMNITQSSYSRLERGSTKIDLERLELFAEVLGMSLIDVLAYPEHYINVKDIAKEMKAYEPDVMVQFKVKEEKREAVLKAILGEKNIELLQ